MSDDEQHNHTFEQVRMPTLLSADLLTNDLVLENLRRPAPGPPRPSPCNALLFTRTGTSSSRVRSILYSTIRSSLSGYVQVVLARSWKCLPPRPASTVTQKSTWLALMYVFPHVSSVPLSDKLVTFQIFTGKKLVCGSTSFVPFFFFKTDLLRGI